MALFLKAFTEIHSTLKAVWKGGALKMHCNNEAQKQRFLNVKRNLSGSGLLQRESTLSHPVNLA